MKVSTHHSGSYVVVFHGRDQYIDVRKDCRYPYASFIEVVRGGQVRVREMVHNDNAPQRIVELMKELR